MAQQAYKGFITEISSEQSGFYEKCQAAGILPKLTEIEIAEKHFNVLNEEQIQYLYNKYNDKLFRIHYNSSNPHYNLSYKTENNITSFNSIFDDRGTSLEQEINKIIGSL